MKTKYTPGPWKAQPRFQDRIEIIHSEGARAGASSLVVARVVVRDTWRDEQESNARLIAAAPDMLEAIELAVMYLEDGAPHTALERLRSAIAKAKGNT